MIVNPSDMLQKDIYKLLIGTIVPRPIAWVSTHNKETGVLNLAPFSFFTAVSTKPAMIAISIGPGEGERINTVKDTMYNIQQTGEFVVNVAHLPLVREMHKSSDEFQPNVDEFKEVGVTPIPSVAIASPRVKESPISMECKLEKTIPLGHDTLIIGRVLYFHIKDDLYVSGKIDVKRLQPVGRLAGNFMVVNDFLDLS